MRFHTGHWIVCAECPKDVYVQKHQTNRKYCSRKCLGIANGRRPAWNKGIEYLALRGDKNPKWIADRSLIKRQDRRDNPLYKEWRREVLKRGNYKCAICGVIGVRLQADHIKSYAQFPESRFDVENGRALCVPCHKQTETWGRPARILVMA